MSNFQQDAQNVLNRFEQLEQRLVQFEQGVMGRLESLEQNVVSKVDGYFSSQQPAQNSQRSAQNG